MCGSACYGDALFVPECLDPFSTATLRMSYPQAPDNNACFQTCTDYVNTAVAGGVYIVNAFWSSQLEYGCYVYTFPTETCTTRQTVARFLTPIGPNFCASPPPPGLKLSPIYKCFPVPPTNVIGSSMARSGNLNADSNKCAKTSKIFSFASDVLLWIH